MEQDTRKLKQVSITFITAIIGGILFKLMHIPVPWLLGPMIAVVVGTNVLKLHYVWPRSVRNAGMMIVGYTIGLSMTATALQDMALQLPSMFSMTLLLLLLCSGIAFVVSRLSDSDYSTSLLGCIPGGLSQVILLAEETKGINLAVVTVMQISRLMIIVIVMPLLVMIPVFGHGGAEQATNFTVEVSAKWADLFPNLLIFAVAGIVFAIVGGRIKLPTAYLLGPLIGTTILQLTGLQGPQLPTVLINGAQLMIGTHVGLMLKTNQLHRKVRTISLAVSSGIMLVMGAVVLSIILTEIHPISNATALLSMAPGGMDQMGIIAHEIHANLSIVSGYQLFRLFFIFFAVPPLLRIIFKLIERKKARKENHIS
ncbi:AbrB family transcriptional regulator [Virgibacillus sp. DJP39]|uniref:AbrB family transcriptional regulator n=1 Tax=Virgibacillus sp. DJP39 TaxID=3409790 RepID=UPI003BB737A1